MDGWMGGLFFILVGLLLIGVVIYRVLFVHEKGVSDPLDTIKAQQNKVDTEAGVVENYLKRKKVESQSKFQEAVTGNKAAVTETIHQEAAVASAKLEKEAVPERHEQLLAKEKADTQSFIAVQEAVQGEAGLRKELASVASERLLTIEDLSAVNKHGYMKEIDLRMRQGEIQQDLDAADRYELTQHELINKLTTHHGQLIKERRRIELEETDEYVKQRLLERHDKNIEVVEQLIDGRQTRLLLSENGEENRRSQAEDADSRTDSQEAPETDS